MAKKKKNLGNLSVGARQYASELARRGGKARWRGTTTQERRDTMRALARARWGKEKEEKDEDILTIYADE